MSDLVVSELVKRFDTDQPPHIRQQIVRALGKIPTKRAIETLANAIFDKDRFVRWFAAISLKLLGGKAKDAAPALQKLLETEADREVRGQATVALNLMREE